MGLWEDLGNFLNIGIPVTIIENSEESLNKGISIIENNYMNTFKKGRITKDEIEKRLKLLTGSIDLSKIGNTDIVIEAVFEEMELKKTLLGKLMSI